MTAAFAIKHELPSAAAFKALRDSAGWGDISLGEAQQVLANSRHGVTAYDGNIAIGAARVIGDGVLNAYIQDVVIAPDYRRQGIGTALIQALIVDMKNSIPAECTVGLLAAKGQEGFYSSFSFITRPDTDYGAGMFAKLSDLKDGTTS